MNRLTSILFVATLAAAGCDVDVDAEGRVRILPPDDVAFVWDVSMNAQDDGMGALVPLDVLVYDRHTGEPMRDVEVDVTIEHGVLLPEDGLMLFREASCATCVSFWDAQLDRTVLLDETDGVSSGVFLSDGDGMVRLYAVMDELPTRDGEFEVSAVQIQAGRDAVMVLLQAD